MAVLGTDWGVEITDAAAWMLASQESWRSEEHWLQLADFFDEGPSDRPAMQSLPRFPAPFHGLSVVSLAQVLDATPRVGSS